MNQAILPLTLMPGVGLMTMSTVQLSINLSHELRELLRETELSQHLIQLKIQQMRLLNQGLFCLYISATGFLLASFASLLGSARSVWLSLLGMGIGTWLIAILFLVIFSLRAVSIKQQQFDLYKF